MLPQLLLNVKATNNQADWQKERKTSPHHHHHYSAGRIYCMAFLTASGVSTVVAIPSLSDTSIYLVYVSTLSSFSSAADTLISHFHLLLSPLSLLSPPSLYLLSLSLDLFCLIFRNTLYPCLFTDLSLLVPHLSSQRSLQSRQCTFSVTASPFPLPHLPPLSSSLFIEHG